MIYLNRKGFEKIKNEVINNTKKRIKEIEDDLIIQRELEIEFLKNNPLASSHIVSSLSHLLNCYKELHKNLLSGLLVKDEDLDLVRKMCYSIEKDVADDFINELVIISLKTNKTLIQSIFHIFKRY